MIVIIALYVNITDTEKALAVLHYIKVKTVNEILLKSIKEITDFAKEEKQEFLKVMNKLSDEKREEKYQEDKEKLEKLSSRNGELTTLITKLYEDHALGKIPVKHFDRLFNIYDTEQQDLEKQIQYFEQEIESYHQRKVDTDKFLKMIEKYTDIEELTVPMINEYIEKVVVHEATGGRKGKDRKQQVDVYFNFIGNCQIPEKMLKLNQYIRLEFLQYNFQNILTCPLGTVLSFN